MEKLEIMDTRFYVILLVCVLILSCNERKVKQYYESGNVKCELSYKDDILDGQSNYFYEDGGLLKEQTYKEGVLKKCTYYHSTGELDYEVEMEGEYKNGMSKEYYKSNKLKVEAKYTLGVLDFYNEYDSIGSLVYWYRKINDDDIPVFKDEYINILDVSPKGLVVQVNIPEVSPYQLVPRMRNGEGRVFDASKAIWLIKPRVSQDSLVDIGLEVMINDSIRKIIGWREFNLTKRISK